MAHPWGHAERSDFWLKGVLLEALLQPDKAIPQSTISWTNSALLTVTPTAK